MLLKILDISHLSIGEMILIDATFRANSYPAFQCDKKRRELTEKWGDRPGLETALKPLTERCSSPTELRFGSFVYHRCPCNFTGDIGFIVNMYEAYEKGILAFPGSLVEQPAKSMEAIQMLQMLIAEKQQVEQEQAQHKNSAKQGTAKTRRK